MRQNAALCGNGLKVINSENQCFLLFQLQIPTCKMFSSAISTNMDWFKVWLPCK